MLIIANIYNYIMLYVKLNKIVVQMFLAGRSAWEWYTDVMLSTFLIIDDNNE